MTCKLSSDEDLNKSKLILIAFNCLYTIRIYTIQIIHHTALIIKCSVPCLYICLSSHVHGAKDSDQDHLAMESYVARKVLQAVKSLFMCVLLRDGRSRDN